jgi:glycosyltransferase involved in cell wall biosynthesis
MKIDSDTDIDQLSVSRRVAIFKSNLLPISETFILEQTAAFRRWKPRLFGFSKLDGGLDLHGVDHLTLWSGRRSVWSRILGRLAGRRSLHRRMAKAIRTFGPDLVHVHFGTELQQNWGVFEGLGVPVVATLHGRDITVRSEVWESGSCGRKMTEYPRRLRSLASDPRVTFVAVSRSIREAAIEFGIPADKLVVQHIGIDIQRFSPPPHARCARPLVLFVGRMVEKKGVPYLIHAMARVHERRPDARLVLIGDGPDLGACKVLAERLRVHAEFLGAQSPPTVLEWMLRARILCLPSITASDGDAEGFGMVVLEAQACGVPVITSARGGSDEGIEDGVTGIAHVEKDVDAISRGILELLQDDLLWDRMSGAARRRMVEKFDIRLCTRSLEDRFDELVATSLGQGLRR